MRRDRGFTLLEILVAVLALGLLLAGMLGVLRASLDSWAQVNAALPPQRALDRAWELLREDLQGLGYHLPGTGPGPAGLRVEPDRPILRESGGGWRPWTPADGSGTADILTLVSDLPLPVPAVLAAPLPAADGAGPVPVAVRVAAPLDLEPGDLMLVAGEPVLRGRVAEACRLEPGAGVVPAVALDGGALPICVHPAGAPVAWARPGQAVCWRVVALDLDLDRGPEARPVPCLARFQGPADGAGGLDAADLAPARADPVAEAVTAFRVEAEPDTPFPGLVRVTLEIQEPGRGGRPPRRHRRSWRVAPRNLPAGGGG